VRILDRYIAVIYLANIVSLFVALSAFVVGVDVFLNLKNFVSAAKRVAPEAASTLWIAANTCLNVIDLWGPRLLQLFSYLVGLILIAAMGFTLTTLVRRRELVAGLASGVSLHRLAAPFLLVGAVFIGLAVANQELVLPRIAHLLPRGADDTFKRSLDTVSVPLLKDGAGRLFYASDFDPATNTMRNVHIWERNADGKIARRIRADEASWDGDAWALESPTVEAVAGLSGGVAPARIETDLEPNAVLVKRVRGYGATLSWRQIDEMLSSNVQMEEETVRRLQKIRYGRIAMATANFLALVIALPFFLVRLPQNMVAQTLKSAPVAIGAMIGGALGAAAPLPGLPVEVGVFVPAMVLLPMAIAAVVSIRS
jgi:lipopolysaccharide export system permease protein